MTSNLHVMCTIIVQLCVKSLKGNRYWPTQLNSEQRIRFLKLDLKYQPVFDPMSQTNMIYNDAMINLSFFEIENMEKASFKQLIKKKIRTEAFRYLIEKKTGRHGKGKELNYLKLDMQEYLTEEWDDINSFEKKRIFQWRVKMHFKVKSHFRNMHLDTICDGCRIFESTSEHTLECKSLIGQN